MATQKTILSIEAAKGECHFPNTGGFKSERDHRTERGARKLDISGICCVGFNHGLTTR